LKESYGESSPKGNCIVVWTHFRPECLYLCLDSLRKCRGIENHPIYVACNRDSDYEIPEIANKLLKGLDYEIDVRPLGWLAERANGEAVKEGIRRSEDYCVVLSEDEEVSEDLLEMFDYINENFKNDRLFSVSSSGITMPREYEDADVRWMVESGLFKGQTFAVFKDTYLKYADQYVNEEFYRSEHAEEKTGRRFMYMDYLLREFPGTERCALGSVWGLDGLFQRVITKYNLYTLTSVIPRSHEIGFYGAHVNTNPGKYFELFHELTLEDKVAKMRELIKSGEVRDLFELYEPTYKELEEDHKWDSLQLMVVVKSWSEPTGV